MFENRVPHMLNDDYTPRGALNNFIKDLGIILGEAQAMAFPVPLAAAALQQFLTGAAAGLGREDDAAVVKVYECLARVTVSTPLPSPSLPPSSTHQPSYPPSSSSPHASSPPPPPPLLDPSIQS
ncbi:hypothetical protein CLOP_g1552 [Closterium sp. NIES-67]|nr:hypothetical protein CLOP_g1552 [Closterium sp. NIES-67]